MSPSDTGIPPIALMQLLERGTLGSRVTGEFRDVMLREGTDLAALIRRGEQVPLRWFYAVYPELDVDQATDLGMTFAEEAQLTTFGPLSLPLISAGSVSEVVELLTYLPVISTAVSPQFHPSKSGLTVGISGNTADPVLDCLAVSYCGCALLRLLEMLAGRLPDVTLGLSWPATPLSRRRHQVVEGRIIFDAPTSFLHIPSGALDEVCRFSDPVSYRVAVDSLRQLLDSRNELASTTEQVTRLVERDPAAASTVSVAAELRISVSTLKRRLADERTSFRELRQDFLQARAALLLLDRSSSVSSVANNLGYSDVASFSNAFKRWTGRSPRDFRLSVRG